MNDQGTNARKLRKRMWITIILVLLALLTVIISAMSGAFNFHKGRNIMPDLLGMDESAAVEVIEDLGAKASVSYQSSTEPEGTVIQQGLAAGETVTHNRTVASVVSRGNEPDPEETSTMQTMLPNFVGLSMELAEATAEELGVNIVVDGYVYDDYIPYGSVAEQSPEGGTVVIPGSVVTVKLSAGPEMQRYTITVICGTGGSVSPGGNITVEEGEDVTLTITPDEGYAVESLIVDGDEIRALTSYTFLAVDSDHTLSVTFREQITIDSIISQIFG